MVYVVRKEKGYKVCIFFYIFFIKLKFNEQNIFILYRMRKEVNNVYFGNNYSVYLGNFF